MTACAPNATAAAVETSSAAAAAAKTAHGRVFGLAANSIFLFADAVLFPDVNLVPLRHLSSLAAIAVLLYGFVWEAE